MHMHSESYSSQQIRRKRERGQKMANARWQRVRQQQRELARAEQIDPLRVPGRIIQRIVVITGERDAVEIIRRNTTSAREWARMKRAAGV